MSEKERKGEMPMSNLLQILRRKTQARFRRALLRYAKLSMAAWLLLLYAAPAGTNEYREVGEVALKILPMQNGSIWLQPYVAGANGFKLLSGPWPPVSPCTGVWKWGYEFDGQHHFLVAKCGSTILQMTDFSF